MMPDATKSLSYREAMAELQTIVTRLRDTEDVDVDDLVTDVARAKELIDFCGAKIKRADAAIKTIVGEIQVPDAQAN
jgi:exodeoxyribonuclease VII small subunit